MTLKNVKYVLIDENNEPIKIEDGNFDIKNAEIILENIDEVEEFNASNLENSVETTHILYFCGVYIFTK